MSRAERFRLKYESKPEIDPQTSLAEILVDKDLSDEEQRLVTAVDILDIPYKDRRILTGAYIFIHDSSGFFRVQEVLDANSIQAVGMRDKVVTNKKFQPLYERLNYLMHPFYSEVAIGKKEGKKHKEIAEELGLTKQQVDAISKSLISVGAIEMSSLGKKSASRFSKVVEAVDKEDSLNKPRLPEKELAIKLSVSVDDIRRSRKRIKTRHKPYQPNFSERTNSGQVFRRRQAVRRGLERGLSNREISSEYDIPFILVRNDRRWWIEKGEIQKVTHSREQNREKLELILQDFLEENPDGTFISLKDVQRNWEPPISHYSLWTLYSEIEAAGKHVPPLRRIARRINNNSTL